MAKHIKIFKNIEVKEHECPAYYKWKESIKSLKIPRK